MAQETVDDDAPDPAANGHGATGAPDAAPAATRAGREEGRPEVTVVIASVNGLPYPLGCLEALAAQDGDVPIEVIVADCTGPATVAAIRQRHPDVRVLAYDERKSVPWLRAAGLREAKGRLAAVTEDHCVPRHDWIDTIVAAHERTGWAAVGGPVENAATDRLVDWSVFFCEYHRHMAPVPAGPADSIPGMNVAYDMDALGPMRELFAEGLWENFLHDKLKAAGFTIGIDADMIVGHDKYFTIPMFWNERFNYSRSFAGMRVDGKPLPVKVAWAAASLALPPLLVYRVVREVRSRGRHERELVRAMPLVVLFSIAWSIGEMVGYLAGPGDSLVKVR